MKRDMDLIREILLKVEDDPQLDGLAFKTFDASDFKGHSDAEITYHVDLLFEAGLVRGMPNGNPRPLISSLTWQGHEFASATKDPRIWDSVKQRLKGVPDMAFSVIREIVKAEAIRYLAHGR